MIGIKSNPFLRIIVPYAFGIICILLGISLPNKHLLFLLSFALFIASFLFYRFLKPQSNGKKNIFFISAYLLLFLLAFETSALYDAKTNSNHYTRYIEQADQEFIATVSEMPVATEKSLKLNLDVNVIRQGSTWHYATGTITLYLRKPFFDTIYTGNKLWLHAKLSTVNPPKNPGEFDYKTFLERRNIFHTVYAESPSVRVVGIKNLYSSLKTAGVAIKEYVVNVLRESGLSQEAFSICTALLVGYDDEISGDVMQSFSHSGTLHILSVSGMHTGLLYVVLLFVFNLFDKHDRYKKLRCFFVIFFLLLFVAITGFSPSVLRAALMLALVLLGKTFNRNSNPYNTLLVSAFLLLLYNPYLLSDVGFLLSYLAVFGIMYLYPIINNRWKVNNRLLKFCWDLSLMSVAATLFTLPVTLYYFHQFPLWFIVSNLVIIPLSIVLMGAAFLLLLCSKVLLLKQGLAFVINALTSGMLWTASLTDQPGYGFVDSISFSVLDVAFCCLTIFLLIRLLYSKSYKVVASFLVCITLWVTASVISTYRKTVETELLVFSVKHKSASLLRTGHAVYLTADSLSETEFRRCIKPYLLNYPGYQLVYDPSDAWRTGKEHILKATRPFQNLKETYQYVIISHNSQLDLKSLQHFKPLVIADCSNSYNFVRKLKKQCAKFGIPFYSVKESGAFKISFDRPS